MNVGFWCINVNSESTYLEKSGGSWLTGGDNGAGDTAPGGGDTMHGGGDIHGEGERQGSGDEGGGVESLEPPKSDRRSPEKK